MEVRALFSYMPPCEPHLVLILLRALLQMSAGGMALRMAFFDIRRAHFYGTLDREMLGDLLDELKQKHGRDVVAELKRS